LDLFILDDGFQHRRLRRDLDLVLVNATEPFGFGRVLPRGLLRESLSGLKRAGAFIITRADQVDEDRHATILQTLRRYNPAAPVYRCAHAPAGFRSAAAGPAGEPDHPPDALRGKRYFAFAGIGDPASFERQLARLAAPGGTQVGSRWLADHARYSAGELDDLTRQAHSAGAEVMVTTEKDWVKLESLAAERAASPPAAADPPIWRAEVRMRFLGDDEEALLRLVRAAIARR
jgi:tetraacyldisaccharide 4'-kinase